MPYGTYLDIQCQTCGSLVMQKYATTDKWTYLTINVPVCIKCTECIESAAYAEGFTAGQESMS